MLDRVFVSFVVIAYNEAENIARTLEAIAAQDGLGRYEIIVVNDGSSDGTAGIVGRSGGRNRQVRLIDLPENRGRGYARSTGTAAARGELIATVDGDIILPAGWLVRAREALRDHDAVGGTAVPDGDVAYLLPATRARAPGRRPHHGRDRQQRAVPAGGLRARRLRPVAARGRGRRAEQGAQCRRPAARMPCPGCSSSTSRTRRCSASLRWLFVSGKGATRQLLIYRQVRTPDLAAGAFVAAATAGRATGRRAATARRCGDPRGGLLAASTQHVRSRFETPLVAVDPAWCPPIAVDCAAPARLLHRPAGRLSWLLWRRRPVTGSGPGHRGGQPVGLAAVVAISAPALPAAASTSPAAPAGCRR